MIMAPFHQTSFTFGPHWPKTKPFFIIHRLALAYNFLHRFIIPSIYSKLITKILLDQFGYCIDKYLFISENFFVIFQSKSNTNAQLLKFQ